MKRSVDLGNELGELNSKCISLKTSVLQGEMDENQQQKYFYKNVFLIF